MFFIVHVKSSLVSGRSFPTEYVVLSLSKLQISDYSTKKKIPLMDIWNNSGPNLEPCVIPWQISDHLLYEEPTLVLYFLESNRKLRLPSSNPYDSNFEINKSCDEQKIKKRNLLIHSYSPRTLEYGKYPSDAFQTFSNHFQDSRRFLLHKT